MERRKEKRIEFRIGKRYLVLDDFLYDEDKAEEVIVKEVSPNKKFVKFECICTSFNEDENISGWHNIDLITVLDELTDKNLNKQKKN